MELIFQQYSIFGILIPILPINWILSIKKKIEAYFTSLISIGLIW